MIPSKLADDGIAHDLKIPSPVDSQALQDNLDLLEDSNFTLQTFLRIGHLAIRPCNKERRKICELQCQYNKEE